MFDLSNKKSFDNLDSWLRDVRDNSAQDVKVFLVGNQLDLCEKEENRMVNAEDAENYVKSNKLNGFREASAKSGINVEESFEFICNLLYNSSRDKVARTLPKTKIDLRPTVKTQKKKKTLLETVLI